MNRKRAMAMTLSVFLLVVPFAFAQEPSDASMDQAKRMYRNGDYRGAISALASTVDSEERADALYLVGYSHFMLREFDEAVDAFSRAFAVDPGFDPRTIYQRTQPEPAE